MPKNCQDLEVELEDLKARIRDLSLAQAQAADAPPPETAEVHTTPLPGPVPLDFEELVDVLKQEVEDMHPLTCLAIFGLGVLTGRLLAH